ncbi:MAG: hypothetical protein CMH52_01550 [Myxococcales bacterium]|nr:hypothetical protein [Myxococcales bacterium]|tara:strand:- start:38 stop:661 length:624 start_codon:yes stop_codon:yes gene_type:complete
MSLSSPRTLAILAVGAAALAVGLFSLVLSSSPNQSTTIEEPLPDPSLDQKMTETAGTVKLPDRTRFVYSGGTLSKRKWIKRMRLERRFQRDLCGQNDYLVRCLTAFKNPITKTVERFSRRDCIDAVTTIVSMEGNPGGNLGDLQGAFFADDLPQSIDAGLEMDVMADRLGFRISKVLLPKLAQRGGKHRQTPYCNALMHRAFEVDGN